jgi:TrmH family RNA methyltransferase
MLSKNEIKYIQSLSQKKYRDELNLFIAEGPKIVSELAALIPQQFEAIYATAEWGRPNVFNQSLPLFEISKSELERISELKTPNQVLAILKKFPSRRPEASRFTLYLDAIQDPGNFGTILRIADWFGVHDIVCAPGCADLYNPKVVQSTMASIARVNVYYDEEESWLEEQVVPVYAATLLGEPLEQTAKTEKGILIIGNESKGISGKILQQATKQVTIKKRGQAESLNAAVATGIILSHLLQ